METDIQRVKNRTMSLEESDMLLKQCLVGKIGTIGNDFISYVTPVNYVYEPESKRIYVHHSSKGRHLLANQNYSSRVCFEVDQPGEIVNTGQGMHICDADQVYGSVIYYGLMSIVNGDEKTIGLRLLGRKYFGKPVSEQIEVLEPVKLARLVVLAMGIEKIMGKCREVQSLE